MQRLSTILVVLSWGLWVGGLAALFIFVLTLFHGTAPATEDLPVTAQMAAKRDIAVQAAPQLFLAYQKYHLILAAIALVATVAWRIVSPSKLVLVNFILLAVAACCGVAVAIWIMGPMQTLREHGLSGSDQFKRLHGQSMMLFTAQAAMLLVSGIVLPLAIASDARRDRQTARGTDSPA
jgi:hypothetical protein